MDYRLIAAKDRTNKIIDMLVTYGYNFIERTELKSLNLPSNISWAYGATRLVVWDDDHLDYVVKIPLNEYCFKYNEKEGDVYRASVVAGVDEYFAWTEFIDNYYGVPVYAMSFVECDCDYIDDSSYEKAYLEWCKEMDKDSTKEEVSDEFNDVFYSCDMYYEAPYNWFLAQIDKKRGEVDRFISEVGVSDIHSQNLGFLNNHVCLLDYAGYGW